LFLTVAITVAADDCSKDRRAIGVVCCLSGHGWQGMIPDRLSPSEQGNRGQDGLVNRLRDDLRHD
jgi:hypothetical protein